MTDPLNGPSNSGGVQTSSGLIIPTAAETRAAVDEAFRNAHARPDTDTDKYALHHTLGRGAFQAAAGNHDHGDIGDVKFWPWAVRPDGWLILDGSEISKSAPYDELYSLAKGYVTETATTWFLPDMRGRAPVGIDTGQVEFNTLLKTGGEKTHLLTAAESGLPDHTHSGGATGPYNVPSGTFYGLVTSANTGGVNGGAKNASQAHNNLQPYITGYWLVRYASDRAAISNGNGGLASATNPNWSDSGWIRPTLLNGWVDYDARVVVYRKLNGVVYLQGIAKSGTVGMGTPIFNLPQGYRPRSNVSADLNFIIASNAAAALGGYNSSTGAVAIQSGSNVWVDLGSFPPFPADN